MQITIYSNFSKEANSTKQPSGGTAVSCTLKENVSVLNPIFILDRTDTTINYVYWDGRYYFVTDIVFLRATTIELHCKVDSMATYKANIGSSTQFVTRAAYDYDPILMDSLYPVGGRGNTTTIPLNNIHTQMTDGGSYIIGVLGGGSQTGITYYQLLPSTFAQFVNVLYSGNYLQAPVSEISLELQKELVNPIQYITSVQWFPFTPDLQANQPIKFGFWNSNISAYIVGENESLNLAHFTETVSIPLHPQVGNVAVTRAGYLNNSPFTKMLAHIYSFGDIVLDASAIRGSATVNVDVDLFTGVGYLYIENELGDIIARSTAQIGAPIPIGQTTQNLINSAVGAISTVGALAQGNFMGMLSGVGDAVNGLLPQLEKSGAYGSRIAFKETPSILVTHYYRSDTDKEHLGSPLMQRRTISALPGYIQVEKPDVDIIGTVQEKDEIVAYMQGGFYYE